MNSTITIDQISVLRGETVILRDVSLNIPEGAFVTLVGPSGAGKSTLLKCINRLIEPTTGSVRLGDRDVRTLALELVRRSIGYVFQGTGLFPHMTVAENISITPRLRGDHPQQIDERVTQLMDLVELPRSMKSRLPNELSGGQRQRVGIARALAADARIVIMDEPFGALDPVTRDSVAESYMALHRRLQLTTVMVTHDMAEALLLSDRVIVLDDGAIRMEGAPADLMRSDDATIKALVDVPRRNAERLASLGRAGQ